MRRPASLLLCASVLVLTSTEARAAGPEGGLDARGWELVSPEKNGGQIEAPGAAAAQAAAGGGAITYGSASSFGPADGAAPVSQYLGARGGASWEAQNLTPAMLSGTYAGGAYLLFSSDLSRGLLTSGWRCRDGGSGCGAENPPLGAGVPTGYRNLYLRENGSYQPLMTTANAPALTLAAADFQLALEGSTPDLRHVVFSTCAALTAEAVEAPAPGGCEADAANLYLWSGGALKTINLPPASIQSVPGAELAAPSGAIAADGTRVYWRGADGNLYLREDDATVQVDAAVGGAGEFQTASTDGGVAFFTKAGHLYRFAAVGGAVSDLTPAGGVAGVLGTAADGSRAYYLGAGGLFLWQGGGTVEVAATADASNYPPATGTGRVSADGSRLAFLSSVPLTGYPNAGKTEVFLYDAIEQRLVCASCNPRGSLPLGASTIPGARAAGGGPPLYKPRALSADGTRLFFDSADAIAVQDTNNAPDVYQWQAWGSGGCTKAAGCVGLISSGRREGGLFVDAGADGADVFFLTGAALASGDAEGLDLYDARIGGGFPEVPQPIPCFGDDCQGPPPRPDDPVPPTAYLQVPGNPPVRFAKSKKTKAKKTKRKKAAKNGDRRRGNGKKGGRR